MVEALMRLIGTEGHCEVCHIESETGEESLAEIDLGVGADGKERYCYVCCDVLNAHKDWLREKKSKERDQRWKKLGYKEPSLEDQKSTINKNVFGVSGGSQDVGN